LTSTRNKLLRKLDICTNNKLLRKLNISTYKLLRKNYWQKVKKREKGINDTTRACTLYIYSIMIIHLIRGGNRWDVDWILPCRITFYIFKTNANTNIHVVGINPERMLLEYWYGPSVFLFEHIEYNETIDMYIIISQLRLR
jgi:hypothetical protein